MIFGKKWSKKRLYQNLCRGGIIGCLLMSLTGVGGAMSAAEANRGDIQDLTAFNRVAAGVWGDIDTDACEAPPFKQFKYYEFADGKFRYGYSERFDDSAFMMIDQFYHADYPHITYHNEYGHEVWTEMYFLQNAFFELDDPANIFVYMGKDTASAKRGVRSFVSENRQGQYGLQTWKDEYNKILDYLERMRGWNGDVPALPYQMHDINQDGISEMFLCLGTCAGDHRDILLTVDMATGQARYVTALSTGHSDIYVTNEPNVFLRIHRTREGTRGVKYMVVGDRLVEQTLSEAEIVPYQNAVPIKYYMPTDRSGLM